MATLAGSIPLRRFAPGVGISGDCYSDPTSARRFTPAWGFLALVTLSRKTTRQRANKAALAFLKNQTARVFGNWQWPVATPGVSSVDYVVRAAIEQGQGDALPAGGRAIAQLRADFLTVAAEVIAPEFLQGLIDQSLERSPRCVELVGAAPETLRIFDADDEPDK